MRSSVDSRYIAAIAAAVLTSSISSFNYCVQPVQAAKTIASEGSRKFVGSGSGQLIAMAGPGKKSVVFPLKHTDVTAEVAGYVARVTVKQIFENPSSNKIEAVYTFPLSDSAAVDKMEMKVGKRTIYGTIKKREEARQIYDNARNNGHVAALLDQERTNIFTQSVANIEPGAKVEIILKYVDLLPYEAGKYTFAFPTVVGPRFMPGNETKRVDAGTGRVHDTSKVPDASRISPVVAEERAGQDLSINVHINEGGLPLSDISSKLHEVDIKNADFHQADVVLKSKNTIPNRDFVLSWAVAADTVHSGYLTHHDPGAKRGFFTLMMMPPKRTTPAQVAPKEMIFLVDCSGSQSGPPLEKAKEALLYILDHMNANDTFQVVSFSDSLKLSSEKPLKATSEMKEKARKFVQALQADGGTWMAPAVEKVCATPADAHRLRIVTFMTDGYVGNDYEVLGMVRKLRGNSRWFPFGTGDSVNRTLIDGIAREGGGEPEYVLLNTSGSEIGKKFYNRISSPVLTDISLNWHGLPVKEVFPHGISDVWAERPLYICGTYTKGGEGTVTISGYSGGKPYKQDLHVVLPETQAANDVLAPIWARQKVDRLMSEDWFGAQTGKPNKELKNEIIDVALENHIMTQYTSFVAVEDKAVTKAGPATKINVPVDIPLGVSRANTVSAGLVPPPPSTTVSGRVASHAAWYKASRQIQIVDAQPVIQDYRSVSSAGYGSSGGYGSVSGGGFGSGSGGGYGGGSGAVYGAPAHGKNGGAFLCAPLAACAPSPSPRPCLKPSPMPKSVASSFASSVPCAPPAWSADSVEQVSTEKSQANKQGTFSPAQKKEDSENLKDRDEDGSAEIEETKASAGPLTGTIDHAKLEAKLNLFLANLNKNPQGVSGVTLSNGKFRLRIKLTSMNKAVLDLLRSKGVVITITEADSVIAEVPQARLLELTAIPEIKFIEPVSK